MKKKSKYGVNTGNTMWPGMSVARNKRYAKDQCILIKKLKNQIVQPKNSSELNSRILKKADALINDGDVNGSVDYKFRSQGRWWWRDQEIVVYTLNKRKRWELPDRIKEAIDEIKRIDETSVVDHDTQNFKITLAERESQGTRKQTTYYRARGRHLLPQDCIGYHDTGIDLEEHHIYPNHKYSFQADLKEKGKSGNTDDKRKKAKEERRKGHNQHFRDLQRPTVRKSSTKKQQNRDQNNAWIFRAHPPEDEHRTDVCPEIHYEVCYPQPMLAHKAFSDEHYFFYGHKGACKIEESTKAIKKCKHARNKGIVDYSYRPNELKTIRNNWKEDQEELLDDLYDEVYQMYQESVEDPVSNQISHHVDIYEYITSRPRKSYRKNKPIDKSAFTEVLRPNIAMSKPVNCRGKNSFQYIDPNDSGDETNQNTTQEVDRTCTMQEVTDVVNSKDIIPQMYINVSTDSVSPKWLEHVFGDTYYEGNSVPRKFVVNLSEYSNSVLGATTGGYDLKGNFVTVCTICTEHELGSDKFEDWEGVTKYSSVGIQIDGELDSFEEATIQQELTNHIDSYQRKCTQCTINEVIDVITEFLWKKKADQYKVLEVQEETLQKYPKHKIRSSNFKHLATFNKWHTKCHTLEDAHSVMKDLPLTLHKKKLRKTNSISVVRDISDSASDEVCDICFNNISCDQNGHSKGTALVPCHHWFCNDCWRHHLLEGIRNGSIALECPAFECENVVDHATLMSLVTHKYYMKHWLHVQNVKLEQHSEWKWCPRMSCSKVVRALANETDPSEEFLCVNCDCCHIWCFDCQQEPHWPASCTLAEKYVKMVKQREEDAQDRVFFVEVKKCPSCKHPINKNGGCQHMVCRCGFSFCWECLAAWSAHGNTLTCPNGRAELSTVELEDNYNMRMREYYYQVAVKFRKKRQNMHISKCNMETKLLHIMMKSVREGNRTKRKSRIRNESVQSLREKDEFRSTLTVLYDALHFLYQLYHVLEFSNAFLSQTKTKCSLTHDIAFMSLLTEKFEHILFASKNIDAVSLVQQLKTLQISSEAFVKRTTRKVYNRRK